MAAKPSPEWDRPIVAEYETRVEPFTGSFVEEMMQPFCKQIASKTGGSPTLLDIGCGTGFGSIYASRKQFQVTATDVSSFMVERTKERSTALEEQIECVVSNGQKLPSAWTGRFDYAIGSFSVIFFKDIKLGLEQIYRCLKAEGQIVISSWGNAEETAAFQVFPDAIKEIAPELHESSKPKRITGSPPVLSSLLKEAGFVDVNVLGPVQRFISLQCSEAFFDRFALASPNTKLALSKLSFEKQSKLKQKVMSLVEERGGRSDGSIRIPSSAYFAYGTKPASLQSK